MGSFRSWSATWLDEINEAFDAREFQNVRLHAESVWRETQVVGENLRVGLAASHDGAALTMFGQFEDATHWQDRAEVALALDLAYYRIACPHLSARSYSSGIWWADEQ